MPGTKLRALRRALSARLPTLGQKVAVIGFVGVLLNLVVVHAAVTGVRRLDASYEGLTRIASAQRFFQDADMMHDALRADVADAQQAGRAASPEVREQVLRATEADAARLRGDLEALRRVQVPASVRPAVASLHPTREAYVTLAVQRVRSELRGNDDPSARIRFLSAYRSLVSRQAAVTATLANTTSRAENTQAEGERKVTCVLVTASAAALLGWALLTGMLRRSGLRLFQALRRESQQRAVAEQLQRSLLPDPLPDVSGLRLAARSRPMNSAMRVGGDWYDVIALPAGNVGVVVGDVMGHDLRAAVAMGQLRASVRAFAVSEASPAAVLARVNMVADLLRVTDLTTCLYAVINPSTGRVRWSSAGHLNPLAISAIGQGRVLQGDPGPPIGVISAAVYVDRTCRLEKGGTLLLYTDGLVERRSTSISENLTELERIPGHHDDPDRLCDHVLEVLLADESEVNDDVTLLALQAS
jgi:hypothetical protein